MLNEKLETDLLQVNKHVNGAVAGSAEKSGTTTPATQAAGQQEGLAGLNIGQKGIVGSMVICLVLTNTYCDHLGIADESLPDSVHVLCRHFNTTYRH